MCIYECLLLDGELILKLVNSLGELVDDKILIFDSFLELFIFFVDLYDSRYACYGIIWFSLILFMWSFLYFIQS